MKKKKKKKNLCRQQLQSQFWCQEDLIEDSQCDVVTRQKRHVGPDTFI